MNTRPLARMTFTEDEFLSGTARVTVGRFLVSIQSSILGHGEWLEHWKANPDTEMWEVNIVIPIPEPIPVQANEKNEIHLFDDAYVTQTHPAQR